MKKSYINSILKTSCIALMLSTTACSDFLDVGPSTAGDANKAIETAADADVIIKGLMGRMANASYYGRNFPLYADAKGGDLTITSQGRGYDYLYVFNHSQNSNNFSSIWTQGYNAIVQVNNLLESIERAKEKGSLDNFDKSTGEALTTRALVHFDLVRLYGQPYNEDKTAWGVTNVTTVLNKDAKETRNTVAENYTQIVKDLQEAEGKLPKTRTNGFINYYANKALQARVFLYMEDYDNALKAAQDVMTSTAYKLYENNEWADSWSKEFGSEAIFELGIYPNEGDAGTGSLGAMYRRRGHGSSNILGYFTASTNFLTKLSSDVDDVRWAVMKEDEMSETSDHPAVRLGSSYKYSGSTKLVGDKGSTNSTAVNFKVIRLSEVYLIAAEAALLKASADKALAAEYLNAIRKRSPNLAAATAATITMEMVMDERSKELHTEGHRFFDMMRWNKTITFDDALGAIATTHREATIDRTNYRTILPIPLSEINANAPIKAQQNPGY